MKNLLLSIIAVTCSMSANGQFADFNGQGVAFGHVHLVVADVELHKDLWTELFNAELIEKQGYSAARVSNALIFFRNGEPTAPSVQTAMDHFGLVVPSVERVLSKWRALGYQPDSEAVDANDRLSAFITMPGGVKLALRENPNRAEDTAMGHVHFVTPVINELMAWYEDRFGATKPNDGREDASQIPGSGLSFEASATQRLPTGGAAIDHIGFELEEWDAFIEMLKEEGTEFEFGPAHVESLDLRVAFFYDPSGVLVEITHGLDRF